jgi:hypothetical protein
MRSIAGVVVVGVSLVALSVACSKDPPPAQAPVASAQPGGQPPRPGQPGYQPPTAPPGQPAPPAPGQMSTPGPTALSCQNDSQCITHRCNTQFQKCAFPCVTDADCIQGTTCFGSGSVAALCALK